MDAEEDPGADLSTLRWTAKDTLADGITFHGRVTPEGWILESRRLAGVPIRFSLAEPRRFAGLGDMLAGVLRQDSPFFLGADRSSLMATAAAGGGEPSLIVGEHPLFASTDPAAPPVAHFRKISRDQFEIEVPWQTGFSAWTAEKPIL